MKGKSNKILDMGWLSDAWDWLSDAFWWLFFACFASFLVFVVFGIVMGLVPLLSTLLIGLDSWFKGLGQVGLYMWIAVSVITGFSLQIWGFKNIKSKDKTLKSD